MNIDVFNGDADGICALHQLRLADPVESHRITGVKRDIALLTQVQAEKGDKLTVLDISLDKNRDALVRLLEAGVETNYFDHHFPGDIPDHPNLQATIDTNPTTCTSLLVNAKLKSKYLAWAVTAAFGDNLYDSAQEAAKPLGYSEKQLEQLKVLGTCINYNGYGTSIEDLFFHPDQLYLKIRPYVDPFDFINNDEAFTLLSTGYQQDLASAAGLPPESDTKIGAIFILPNEKWARRVSGVYGNDLARNNPEKAHAVLTNKGDNTYQVSVRAPLNIKTGADELCRQFETGGGRQAAAGINVLPKSEIDKFINTFQEHFASLP